MQTRDRLGEQFGNYRLTHRIGSGGSAEVYRAEHIEIKNLLYAIKVLTGTNLKDEQRVKFLTEARTIANLQSLNPHIVHIYDYGIQTSKNSADDGIPYLVMEFAAEGTLRNRYPHNTRVLLEHIAFYINQVAEALQCAHDQDPPVIHRDIKPENMLLRSRDHVLLSDFGIAITGYTNLQGISLKEKEIAGTIAYMAPERFSNDTHRASDQYALGIVVYEWLCGTLPFDGTHREICYKHLVTPPPPLATKYPQHITQDIENVVMRALEKDPTDRYTKVEEFAQMLARAIQRSLAQRIPNIQSPARELEALRAQPQQAKPPKAKPQQPAAPLAEIPKAQPLPQQLELPPLLLQPEVSPPLHQFANINEPLVPDKIMLSPLQPITTRSTTKPKVPGFFALSSQFAKDQRLAFFRSSGIALNALSAIAIGLLQQNNYILSVSLILSIGMFLLCIHLVEEKLALFVATIIALYWAFVGWSIGSYLVSLWYLNQLLPPLFLSCLFFGVSLGLHIWYVSRKNA